ncbi:Nn.00g092010.m01.CDS01 [Neocucurbitaria sp. VM-36]
MDSSMASSAGIRLNTIVLAFTLVAGMVVFLRLFTRLVLTRAAGFEDACIVLAMALSIALTVLESEQVMHGLGNHSSRLTAIELNLFLKAFWASLWIYNLTLTVTKISILVQYLRIFHDRNFRIACFVILGLVVAYGAWAIFSGILICNPIAFSWDKTTPNGHCMNPMVVWYTNAGMNIAQDVIILLMPMPVIRRLQFSTGQKTGLALMFALGASVTLISVVRLYSLDDISNSKDISFDNTIHAILSAVEVNIGIICACLPVMRPLLGLMIPKHFSAATEHANVPILDIEQLKHVRRPSGSINTNPARTRIPQTVIPRVPRPTLSRTTSGFFSVVDSRSYTPNQGPASHSRSGSSVSVSSTSKNAVHFQGRINPLRSSPVTPSSPPVPMGLSKISPLAPESYTRQPGDFTAFSPLPPQTPSSTKPLPITPFPVISGS